ncbi:alpha/beta fold hydrolase [Phytomonospora endophytica]|uniref:Pimeloyl-ACP methyl ester carboxylesterase n=1 Tax=Phytomonospora endophytica TaxID=714109 RepID=A0A841FV87_9ACTN|nr:alpha/beta hydrolase [Phytomonospora endophytica]MBB6037638.1 pimeloyl-ACP methyl ester carboxylesterase [Phytomonospora endophytica]GIG67835.1 hypothetical protein Pen01_41300 [Phytomonospora endophytica]
MRTFTVEHDDVTLHVTRGGTGRPLVFCPGLNVSQEDLAGLLTALRRDFDVVAFDLSGHGRSTPGPFTVEGFYADLVAVMDAVDLDAPVLMGYSLGADLAVRYAAAHPVGALVVVDGANPLPEPFITEEYLPQFREIFGDPDVLRLNMEVDEVRLQILDRWRRISAPVTLVTSTAIAGEDGPERHNALWLDGFDRLMREIPGITATRLPGDHGLVFAHADAIARIVREDVG